MMNKVSILAVMALMAVGCNKSPEGPVAPVMPDQEAPIAFGATSDVQLTPASKATVALPTDTKLGIFAFRATAVPTTATAAGSALWSNAGNLEYTWNAATSVFKENAAVPNLFWPGSGTANANLSFVSYFPYSSTAVANYVLTQDMTDQSAAPDYAFAWARLVNVARPEPVTSQMLTFNYKVAKLTFAIVGDGNTISDAGISMQSGGTGAGIVSVKVYGASTGVYKTYKLDLLKGTVTGQGVLNSTDKMSLKGVDKTNTDTSTSPATTVNYVEAVGYTVPSTDAGLKTDGITVEIIYNDGTSDQTYGATIKTTDTLTGDAALANGLEAGKNYKYTLKLGKSGITFTGKVTDWIEEDCGDIVLQ